MARRPGGALDVLAARARDLRPALEAIGLHMVGVTQGAFRDQRRAGIEWRPRGVPNVVGILEDLRGGGSVKSRRWEPRPAGIDTGRLRSSIAYQVGATSVTVGSQVTYASDVQLGGSKTVVIGRDLAARVRSWIGRLRGAQREKAQARFAKPLRDGALTINVPPRPFLVVTPEDRRKFQRIAREHVFGARVR